MNFNWQLAGVVAAIGFISILLVPVLASQAIRPLRELWLASGAKWTRALLPLSLCGLLVAYAGVKPPSTYSINFIKNDGSGQMAARKFTYGESMALPTCVTGLGWTRADYDFLGWATSGANAMAGKVWKTDGEKVSTPTAAGTTLNVYAVWKPKGATYKIRFIRNDGAGTMTTVEFPYGVTTRMPTLNAMGWARRGYAFTGWYTSTANIAAGKVWKSDGAKVSTPTAAGMTLDVYAGWQLKDGYYQIRFNKNDGTGKWRTLAYEYGKATVLPTCANGLGWSRTGCTFYGWATSAANASDGILWKEDKASVVTAIGPGKTLSVYAMWEEISKAGL